MFKSLKTKLDNASFIKILIILIACLAWLFVLVALLWLRQYQYTAKDKPTYYAAPLYASKIPGNPNIEPIAVGEKPRGIPADLPLIGNQKIIQAYRSYYPDNPDSLAVVVFDSDKPGDELLSSYNEWLLQRGWSAQLQPPAKPRALSARQADRKILIATRLSGNFTEVTISYAENK